MKRMAVFVLGSVVIAFLGAMFTTAAWAADPPSDQVVAMYFHRTKRCPTCLKMGSYSEEAVKDGFSKQTKEGAVSFYYIDFQDRKNSKLTKAYGITGPALIVAKISDGKVAEFENLKEIWKKVREKPEFLNYVRDKVAAYLQ